MESDVIEEHHIRIRESEAKKSAWMKNVV